MKDPKPINLMTDVEVRAQGWSALSRDADGHLAGMTSNPTPEYIREELDHGFAVTLFPRAAK